MIAVTLKRWAVLCLLPLFAAVAKGETVGIIVTATGLTNSSGAALPDNSLIQVLANTAGQTPGSPTVSSFVSGADVVLASFGLNSSTTGIAGSFQIYLKVDRSAFAGLNSGAPLLLRWYDIPYAAGQTAPGTAAYGQFTTSAIVDDSTSGWTLEFDGTNASLNFVNVANGGSQTPTSGSTAFTIVPPVPTVTAISSPSGPTTGGTVVTLTGTNFTGATAVKFGSISGTNLTVVSATSITITSPAGSAGTVDVTVITPDGTSATSVSDQFTYILPPVVPVTPPSSPAPIRVDLALGNLVHTYDGTQKSATVTSSPNVSASLTYSNSSGAPVNAGSYTVTANVTSVGYSGSAEATLTIAKAAQVLSFAIAGGDFNVGSTLKLNATATTGLPVTFSVLSGNASLSGSGVTITQAGPVTIRATQAGNENYQAVTADRSFTGVSTARKAQTIAFAAMPNVATDTRSVALSATASSGLPVSFAVLSGPATLVGNHLELSGAIGLVTVQASQAGDATFAAAPTVVRAFIVTPAVPDIFFGALVVDPTFLADDSTINSTGGQFPSTAYALEAEAGNVAAAIFAGTNRGTVLMVSPSLGLNVSVDISLNADGTFVAPFTSAGRSLTLTGRYGGGLLTGELAILRASFTTTVLPRAGATANLAGVYESKSVNNATGGTASIVGPDAQVLVVANIGALNEGAAGTINPDGTFNLTGAGVTISGAVDAPSSSLTGTITAGNRTPVSFTGISAVTRTDRLVNLSSRVRLAPGRVLITGFVVSGTESKRILVRGVGPTLAGFGVQAALANPRLQLFDAAGRMMLENDDWSEAETSAAFAQVGAFSLPAGSKDAAILASLAPGAYTVQITAGNETGVALAEIYDASTDAGAETQRVVNISTRGTVDTSSDGLLIGGFVVTGNTPKKVLIRGVGPSLGMFGVSGTLADPRLAVYSGSTVIAQNDDWSTSLPLNADQRAATASELAAAAQSAGAFALGTDTKDAALMITLAPGAYTAQVTGANGSTGAALVEIYDLPR